MYSLSQAAFIFSIIILLPYTALGTTFCGRSSSRNNSGIDQENSSVRNEGFPQRTKNHSDAKEVYEKGKTYVFFRRTLENCTKWSPMPCFSIDTNVIR